MDEMNRRRLAAPAMLMAVSLTAALLEAVAGIAGGPGLFGHFGRTLMSMGATVLWVLAASLLLYGLAALWSRAGGSTARLARAAWCGSFTGAAVLLGSMARVLVWPLYNADLLRWGVILLVAWAAAAGARHGAERLAGRKSPLPPRVMLWAPAAAGALLFLVWWIRYKVDALISAGAAGGAAAAAAGLALAATATLAVRSEATALAILSTSLILILAVPGAGFLIEIGAPAAPAGGGVPGPRQVILISIDTLRADAVSAYGEGGALTPRIDGLAGGGLLFARAYAPSPWTLPSVATLLTGVHPDAHGLRKPGARLSESVPTLAEAMRSAGYRTAAIGSNPHLGRASGLDRGFDEYLFHGGTPPFLTEGPFGARLVQRLFPPAFPAAGTTEELTELALEWLERNRRTPFFLWIHYLDPHVPHTPPARFQPDGEPPEGMGMSFARQNAIRNGYFTPSAEQREWIRKLYDAEVRTVDEAVGRVLDRLRELDLLETAVIVLTSDHGEEFWEHGGYEHGHSLYEEVLRVPLLIRTPAASRAMIDRPVSLESVAPTLLDLAGVPFDPARFPRGSLAGLIAGPAPEGFRPLVAGTLLYHEDRISVRFGDWKYIRPLISQGEELYNLATDPGERISVAESHESAVEEAGRYLKAHFAAVQEMRVRMGEPGKGEKLDDQTLEQLRSLGYVE